MTVFDTVMKKTIGELILPLAMIVVSKKANSMYQGVMVSNAPAVVGKRSVVIVSMRTVRTMSQNECRHVVVSPARETEYPEHGVWWSVCPCSIEFGSQIRAESRSQRQREERSVLVPAMGFTSRDIAPCCAGTQRHALEASLCVGAIRVNAGALKARNA
jgi:hypothetical protein